MTSYKYLGVILQSDLRWEQQKDRALGKARQALNVVAAAGVSRGLFSIGAALRLWAVLVRPSMEYGCQLWATGGWPGEETLQAEMGRVILRLRPGTAYAAIRGELSWTRFHARQQSSWSATGRSCSASMGRRQLASWCRCTEQSWARSRELQATARRSDSTAAARPFLTRVGRGHDMYRSRCKNADCNNLGSPGRW